MGFAKQQTHGVRELYPSLEISKSDDSLIYRKVIKSDKEEMKKFSRLIADYQTQSPCFAAAPQKYLDALDRGFSEITEDPDIDLFVIQDDSVLAGYQGYYDSENPDLIIPEKSVELAVFGVLDEYRGKGCGLNLTLTGLTEQKEKGFQYAVTDWRCANLLSSTFWPKIGFIPVAHRLIRQIEHLQA